MLGQALVTYREVARLCWSSRNGQIQDVVWLVPPMVSVAGLSEPFEPSETRDNRYLRYERVLDDLAHLCLQSISRHPGNAPGAPPRPGSGSARARVEDDLLGGDLVVLVEPVEPGVVDRQLPERRPIHRRGHHEQRAAVVAVAVGHTHAAGHDRLGEHDQALHVVLDAGEVVAWYTRHRARLGARDVGGQAVARRLEVLVGPRLDVGAGELDRS